MKGSDAVKRKDSPFISVALGSLVTFICLKGRNWTLCAHVQAFCPVCFRNIPSSFRSQATPMLSQRVRGQYRLDGTSGDHPGLRSGFRAFVQPSCEHFQGWSSHDHVTLAAQCSAALLTTPFVKRPRQTEAVHLSEKFSSHALNVSPVARTQPLLFPLSPKSLLSQETAL